MFTVPNSVATSVPEAARAIVFCTSAVLLAARRPKPPPYRVALRTVLGASLPPTSIPLDPGELAQHTLSRNVARTTRHALDGPVPERLWASTRCTMVPSNALSEYPGPLPVVSHPQVAHLRAAPVTDSPVSLENCRRVNSSPAPCTSMSGVLICTDAENPY